MQNLYSNKAQSLFISNKKIKRVPSNGVGGEAPLEISPLHRGGTESMTLNSIQLS